MGSREGTVQLYRKVWLTQCDLYLNCQSYKVDGGGGVWSGGCGWGGGG